MADVCDADDYYKRSDTEDDNNPHSRNYGFKNLQDRAEDVNLTPMLDSEDEEDDTLWKNMREWCNCAVDSQTERI